MESPENKNKKNKLIVYVLISLALPVILFYPWAVAENIQGEGCQAGTCEFMPDWLTPYSPWYADVTGEHRQIAAILNIFAALTRFMFYISLINALLAIVIYISHRIKRLLGKHPLTGQPRES
ncbi:MAG: hypothetical protein KKH28_09855 [Elusimicrobia bacterium]|nr:hypothetical protein [Elusimicrobiota bacterium]